MASVFRRLFPIASRCQEYNGFLLKPEVIVCAFYQMNVCCHGNLTAKPVSPTKRKGLVERERHFVDFIQVTVQAGDGGDGLQSFSSLANLEWAGPDGGSGGNGGHVVFTAKHATKSLSHLKSSIRAPRGMKGKARKRDGRSAKHRIIQVPLGTIVRSEGGELLASLDKEEDIFVAARGGAGGRGNYFFLSNENRAPTMSEPGGVGQERMLMVELKTMAHAGLIGFPNAGKSSLLQAISRAQPKVSPYPFTTLNPHVGMVLYDDHVQLAVADIPGLIPGSYQNKGMGISFLRHIERCLCLVYVIDLALERPWEQLYRLRFELDQYMDGLSQRPGLLVANKIDLPGAPQRLERLKERLTRDGRKVADGTIILPKIGDETLGSKLEVKQRLADDRIMMGIEQEVVSGSGVLSNEASLGGPYNLTGSCSIGDNSSSHQSHNDNNNDIDSNDYNENGDDNLMVVLGISAKKKMGVSELLHHLRVLYDKNSLKSSLKS